MRASAVLETLGVATLGVGLAMASAGCAPVGQGDPCTPEAIPGNGFVANEVFVETSSVQCRTRVCMVYHLQGNPECTSGVTDNCSQPAGPTNPCVSGSTNLCVQVDDPAQVQIDSNSPDRVFCTCRCSAGGNSALPLCQCTEGFRCVPDSDPGGGYCVPNDLALHERICVNDDECATLGSALSCDATGHCR
jgi:hypothetical protein